MLPALTLADQPILSSTGRISHSLYSADTIEIMWIRVLIIAALLVPLPSAVLAVEADASFFEKRVRPVLVEHCYKCHSADSKKVKGGLLLDSRNAVLAGGDTKPSIHADTPSAARQLSAMVETGSQERRRQTS